MSVSPSKLTEKSPMIARRFLKVQSQAIEIMSKNIPQDFSLIVDSIIKCRGRVIVSGMGKSEHIGRKLSATLASTGTPSCFVHAAESTPPLFNGVQP